MKILVTGAKGFVGRNLCAQLKNIRDGKAKWYNLPEPIEAIYEYDIDSTPEELDRWCQDCTFVFTLPVSTVRRILRSSWRATSVSPLSCSIPSASTITPVLS